MTPADRDWDEIILRYLDGELDPGLERELRERLLKDPETQGRFVARVRQQQDFTEVIKERAADRARSSRFHRTLFSLAAAAAVLVAVAGALLLFRGSPEPEVPTAGGRPGLPKTPRPNPVPASPHDLEEKRTQTRPAESEEETLSKPTPEKPGEATRQEAGEIKPTSEEPSKKPLPAPANPVPAKPPPPAAATPRETLTAVAILEEVQGEVHVVSEGVKSAVSKGAALHAEQGLQTGPLGWAIFRYPDSTRIELWGSTSLARLGVGATGGKRVALAHGILLANVVKQPADRPLMIETPQGEMKVLGTSFRVLAGDAETVLEVQEGRVRLTRSGDGRTVDVAAGYVAIAAPGADFMPRLLQQQKGKKTEGHPGVDQKKVDDAIGKGVDWLSKNGVEREASDRDELVLYTFLHAGVSPTHPLFQTLLQKTVEQDLNKIGYHTTYRVALHAMFLSELDPAKYQQRIAQCCQLLVDNQCANGQWSYGSPTTFPANYPAVASGAKKVATPGKKPLKPEPVKPATVLQVKTQRQGPAIGDNSNTQYAALGLRACWEANVLPPRDCLELAKKYWEGTQNTADDPTLKGGWGYGAGMGDSSGSITAGGLGSLIIYNHLLQVTWAGDPHVKAALECMGQIFSVDNNQKHGTEWLLYYLYAIERAGVFAARGTFGSHDWYREGANKILSLQSGVGSWDDGSDAKSGAVGSTCFAILFLKRATRPLTDVASVDRFIPK